MARALVAALVSVTAGVGLSGQTPASAPVAKIVPHVTTIHGEKLVDNYRWLREKGSPEVMAHLEAENAFSCSMLSG